MSKNYQVLLTSTPNTINKQLIQFFKENLSDLNKRGMVFDWVVVIKDELDLYKEQGITKFPVLMDESQQIIGANAIGKYLDRNIAVSKNEKRPENENDVRSYLLNEISNTKDDVEDEDGEFKNSVMQKMTEMNKMRGSMGQHTLSTSNPEMHDQAAVSLKKTQRPNNIEHPPPKHQTPKQTPSKNVTFATENPKSEIMQAVKNTKNNDLDDELMEKFWMNQELTEI